MTIECIANKKDWIDIISILFPILVAIFGVYIGFRQNKTASNRLKFDIFEKRFLIYDATLDFILSIKRGGEVIDSELNNFKEAILPARFIYDEKFFKYISSVKDKAIDLQTLNYELEGQLEKQERGLKIQERSELKKWLYKQINEDQLNDNFGKYLKLSDK